MIDYQQTLDDRYNEMYQQLQSLVKRIDVISEKLTRVSSQVAELRTEQQRKRSSEQF